MSLVLAAAALALTGQAAASSALKPASKWHVEYRAGACTLSRRFGDAAFPLQIVFKSSAGAILDGLALTMPDLRTNSARRASGSLAVLPSGDQFLLQWVGSPPDSGKQRRVWSVLPQTALATLPDATALRLDVGGPAPIMVETGPLKAAFAATRRCNDDLLRHWGANPAAMMPYPRSEQILRWLRAENYPEKALRANESGEVRVLISIERTGKPVACRVVLSSGSTSLDEGTCALTMRKGQFDPAAADGPETRYLLYPILWVLPR